MGTSRERNQRYATMSRMSGPSLGSAVPFMLRRKQSFTRYSTVSTVAAPRRERDGGQPSQRARGAHREREYHALSALATSRANARDRSTSPRYASTSSARRVASQPSASDSQSATGFIAGTAWSRVA